MRLKFSDLIGLLLVSTLNAQSCNQLAQNYFACGIPSQEFEYMRVNSVNGGAQQRSNWCWACIQMVLNYHGVQISQSDLVTKIYGSTGIDQPANEQQIITALMGWVPSHTGSYWAVQAQGGYTSITDVVSLLAYKWPLIVGLVNPNGQGGHAYVMTSIFYSNQYDAWGNVIGAYPDKVVLRDPWPSNPSRQELSWQEFSSRCQMAVKVWIQR